MRKHSKSSFVRKAFKQKNTVPTNMGASVYKERYDEMNDRSSKKDSKKRKVKKILLIILCVILGLLVVLASTFAALYFSGKSQFKKASKPLELPESVTTDDENIVKVNGNTYKFDEDVETILFMGVDKNEETQIKSKYPGSAGQADALYLLCIDNKEKKYTVLSINRDSMVDVEVYDVEENFVGTKKMQACLAYAYGDGKEESCENTKKSISRLLYNVEIDSYFSINKASISLLNDVIDGVEVPVYDENGKKTGKTKYLDGKEAYEYIHYRDTSKLDSNLVRMERQKSYIQAFASKLIARTKSDISTPLDMFEIVSLYSTTDLNASKITYLTSNAFLDKSDINIDFKSIPGKVVEGDFGYAEYEIDNDGLLDVVLDIFYDKVD